jgi:hypothetical protein
LPQEQNESGLRERATTRSLFHYEIHRNGFEISSMFQETACKEENPGASHCLPMHCRNMTGEETTQPE